MTPLRRFNPDGIAAFRQYLHQARQYPDLPKPAHLLEDDALAEPFGGGGDPPVRLDPPTNALGGAAFQTKRDAADYLNGKLMRDGVSDDALLQDAGLWTWLTLYYWEAVRGPSSARGRRALNDYYFIYQPKEGRTYYRHILAVSFRVFRRAPNCRLILNQPLTRLGGVTQTLMASLYLTRIPCIFDVADKLYYDAKRGRPKPRVVGPEVEPGDLDHRLPARIRQLERTYDLNVLTADQLIDLLGPEFKQWLDK